MTKYENNKRVCARGVTFIDDKILLIERHKKEDNQILHYFTIPGGGVEDDEIFPEAAVRETFEETCVKTEVLMFLEREEYETGIVYWYLLKYLSGTPKLGGEELERNHIDNHYQVVLIDFKNIEEINILGKGKNILKSAYNIYQNLNNNKN